MVMVEVALKGANGRLKEQNIRLTIEIKDRSLYLRGTLPPREGSGKNYRQRISLGLDATIQGIKLAEAEAIKVSSLLQLGAFDWGEYRKGGRVEELTCGQWVEKFKEDFFSTGEYAKRLRTWNGNYWEVFKWLPVDKVLTVGMLEEVIGRTKPNTRSRKKYCTALERLGKYAGIECSFKHLQGDYGAASLNPKSIPSDEEVLAVYARLPDSPWRLVYGILATYGIRPSEIIYIDRGALPKLIVTGGKTGVREVYPIPGDWVDRFNLSQGELPAINCSNSAATNSRVNIAFKRLGVEFPPQTLRHAYCIRGIVFGLPTEIGAAWAGHSVDLHTRVYQRWIQEGTHRAVYEKYILGK